MSTTDQFLLALQAYQEIRAELNQTDDPRTQVSAKSTPDTLQGSKAFLPSDALLLGMAEDGLPVFLDLFDPTPGPLLVAGDGGSGKTALLQSLARATDLQDPGDISFCVLTPFPEEWSVLEFLPHCLGVWPAYHPSAANFLSQLVGWADTLPKTRQTVLLLYDGWDLMSGRDFQIQHDLRWLLLCGPQHHIWPVISVNPGRMARLQTWLDYFHTRLFGRVKHARYARPLLEGAQIELDNLLPGKQFGLLQSGKWIKFWLPPLADEGSAGFIGE